MASKQAANEPQKEGEMNTTKQAEHEYMARAYEDDGGGLSIVIRDDDGEIIYCHSGYEMTQNSGERGQLLDDLCAIVRGENPREWEGNELDEANREGWLRDIDRLQEIANAETNGRLELATIGAMGASARQEIYGAIIS